MIGEERYRLDRGAALAPVDLALGWGMMSDSAVLKQISVSQSERSYSWWVNNKNYPVPRTIIEAHSANMHMIPANHEFTNKDGFRWKISLTRSDTGAGACELIWVESLETWLGSPVAKLLDIPPGLE